MGIFSRRQSGTGAAKRAADGVRVVDHPAVGEIRVAVSDRARRINLTVRPDGSVRLSVPRGVPLEKALEFLDSKTGWVLKCKSKYPRQGDPVLPPFSTRHHNLVLWPGPYSSVRVRVAGGEVKVTFPATLAPDGDTVQKAIKRGIEQAWRTEAREFLPARLLRLSALTGLKYRSVTVRNTVSKWGSCSARDDISLSVHLMRLPDHLVDYVLLHELCHTVHKNHGPGFHRLLDSLTGGRHPELRRELKTYHTRW